MGDQRYVKYCRDNSFPVPSSHSQNEAHEDCRSGYPVYVKTEGRESEAGEEKLDELLSSTMDEQTVEREFWYTMSSSTNFTVQYANDVEGTASGDFNAWDLTKFPTSSRCLLRLLPELIPGVTTPMLYIGMLFAHFCWHYEDNALYSINVMHAGAPKTWYVVPGYAAAQVEKAADEVFASHPDRYHPLMHGAHMLMRKTVMMSPSILLARGVPVYRATQRPREIIVTFPRGYHSGFNHGFHTGEAINFALPDWIPYGLASLQRYRSVAWLSVIDMERLILDMAQYLSKFKARTAGPAHACLQDVPAAAANIMEDSDTGKLVTAGAQHWARTPNLICRKFDTASDAHEAGEATEAAESHGWEELIDRPSLTAILSAFTALAGWQQEVHAMALQTPRIQRVAVLDERHRRGTGTLEVDRLICCACNHVLHSTWIEHDDEGDDGSVDEMDYWQQRALKPRACPDHMDFLGESKALKLCMRYPLEHFKHLLKDLESFWPLALATSRAGNGEGVRGGDEQGSTGDKGLLEVRKWKQRKWKLHGLTGESLGLTICWHKSTEAGQEAESACSPPTPAVCAACRRRGLGLDKAASGNESFCRVPVFHTSLSNISLHSNVCSSEGNPRTTEPKMHLGAREEKCSCPQRAQACTRLPRSPLYRSKNFPTIQSLLSKSSAAEGLGGVTPCAFRKHMLRLKPELRQLVPALAQADSDADIRDMDKEVKTQPAREASASDASAHASASPHAAVASELSPNDKLQDPRAATTPASARDRNRGSDTKESLKRAVKRRTQDTRKDEDAGEEDADKDLPLSSRLLKLKEQPARKEEAAAEDGTDDIPLHLSLRARLLKKEQKARKGGEHGEVGVQKERDERVNPDVECPAEACTRAPRRAAAVAATAKCVKILAAGQEEEEEQQQQQQQQNARTAKEHGEKVGTDESEDDDLPLALKVLRAAKKPEHKQGADEDKCKACHGMHRPHTCRKVPQRKLTWHSDTPPTPQDPLPCRAVKAEDLPHDPLSAEKNKRKQGRDFFLQHTDRSEARDARSLPAEGGGCYERKRWKVVHFVETQRSDGSLAMTLRLKRKRAVDEGV
jgi:hypothetical protein